MPESAPQTPRPNRPRSFAVDESTRADILEKFRNSSVKLNIQDELVFALPYDVELNAAIKAIRRRFNPRTRRWHVPVAFHASLASLLPMIDEKNAAHWRDRLNGKQREAEEDLSVWLPEAQARDLKPGEATSTRATGS